MIIVARDFDSAELRQMVGDELGVEQPVAAQSGGRPDGRARPCWRRVARLNMLSPKKAPPKATP